MHVRVWDVLFEFSEISLSIERSDFEQQSVRTSAFSVVVTVANHQLIKCIYNAWLEDRQKIKIAEVEDLARFVSSAYFAFNV